jgi:GNAT superfamily N-acetyltransferase
VVTIRPVRPEDIDQLYAISLATGAGGGDASHLYRDGRMMGHIYSAPYAKLSPETGLVVEDDAGVAGYIVGTFDTRAFEAMLERDWWPALRAVYPAPSGDADGWDVDKRRAFMIHRPTPAPASIVDAFPAHLHMNLLLRMQGQGIGSSLLDRWVSSAEVAGVKGIHVAVNAGNHSALRFWETRNFSRLAPPIAPPPGRTIWFGRAL